ncbi:MAG: YvrJ family protein [Podoviridae sp. ctdc61]|nr:MAG: YvrJ family protein [Podoviridae sp. ctdc61]
MDNNNRTRDFIDDVVKLINGVGFPIVVSMALFWFNIQSLNNQGLLLVEFDKTMQANRVLLENMATESTERSALAKIIINDLKELKGMIKQ